MAVVPFRFRSRALQQFDGAARALAPAPRLCPVRPALALVRPVLVVGTEECFHSENEHREHPGRVPRASDALLAGGQPSGSQRLALAPGGRVTPDGGRWRRQRGTPAETMERRRLRLLVVLLGVLLYLPAPAVAAAVRGTAGLRAGSGCGRRGGRQGCGREERR